MKITASEPLKAITLEADDEGITFTERAGFGSNDVRRHTFREIDAILREEANIGAPTLSIQVGTAILRIPYKSWDQKQCAVVEHIVQKTAQTKESS